MTHILLLHPGAMGSSIGAALRSAGHDVYWIQANRSIQSRDRAHEADLTPVPSLKEGLDNASIIMSVCPPEAALTVAWEVATQEYQGIYVDANATSPSTTRQIASLFADDFVDGGIIGPPARRAGSTRMYLSGPNRQRIVDLFEGTLLSVIGLDDRIDTASALKMCYASYTKGTSALLLALRALADHHGITDALLSEWAISQPGLEQRSTNAAPGTSGKGWRFVGEMNEISKTYLQAGLPGGFHQAAADIYGRMTPFKDQEPAELSKVIEALLNRHFSEIKRSDA